MRSHATRLDPSFVPADSAAEAAARLFALTGSTDPGSRGPKRALGALATSLRLDVDLAATNAIVGRSLAQSLEVDWSEGRDFEGLRVTVDGLNNLLRAASRRLWLASTERSVDLASFTDVLRSFPTFNPAVDKQEAINRLSDLSGVPRDTLGPGGKEHRVTFESLAAAIAPDLLDSNTAARSKHSLVISLCERLSVPWISTGGSTGQSVTLEGLNLLLAGAERRLEITSAGWSSVGDEANALVGLLADQLPRFWDGRATVEKMRADGSRSWRQMEWFGWFFEEQVAAILNTAYPTPPFGGPQRVYGATVFDYASSRRVWDAKAHTVAEQHVPSGRRVRRGDAPAILNDAAAIRECARSQGIGFLILDGIAGFDESGEFDLWHRAYTREGRVQANYRSNSGKSRRRKMSFAPSAMRALWIPNEAALDAGIAGGWMQVHHQGAQQARADQVHGTERRAKYRVKEGESGDWVVAECQLLS